MGPMITFKGEGGRGGWLSGGGLCDDSDENRSFHDRSRSINGKMDGGGGCKLDRYFLIADLVLLSRTIRRVEWGISMGKIRECEKYVQWIIEWF